MLGVGFACQDKSPKRALFVLPFSFRNSPSSHVARRVAQSAVAGFFGGAREGCATQLCADAGAMAGHFFCWQVLPSAHGSRQG